MPVNEDEYDAPDNTRHVAREESYGFNLADTILAIPALAEAVNAATTENVRDPLTRALNSVADLIEEYRVSVVRSRTLETFH